MLYFWKAWDARISNMIYILTERPVVLSNAIFLLQRLLLWKCGLVEVLTNKAKSQWNCIKMLSSTSVLVCVLVACVVVQLYRRTVTQRNTMSNGLTGAFNLIHHFPALTSISQDLSPPPCPQEARTLWGPGQIFHSICLTFVMIYFVSSCKSRSEAEKPTVF